MGTLTWYRRDGELVILRPALVAFPRGLSSGGLTRSDSLAPASVLAPAPDIERSALRTSATLHRRAQLRRVRLLDGSLCAFFGTILGSVRS